MFTVPALYLKQMFEAGLVRDMLQKAAGQESADGPGRLSCI